MSFNNDDPDRGMTLAQGNDRNRAIAAGSQLRPAPADHLKAISEELAQVGDRFAGLTHRLDNKADAIMGSHPREETGTDPAKPHCMLAELSHRIADLNRTANQLQEVVVKLEDL